MTNYEKYKKAMQVLEERTSVPMMNVKLIDNNPTIFDSRVGGVVGYLPKGEKIPTDSKGNQLRLLAQINCEDVGLEEFPEKGILQFWVLNDDSYGLNFNNSTKQDTFRVIYHENIDRTVNEQDILSQVVKTAYEISDDYFVIQPSNAKLGLEFEKTQGFLTDCDYRFEDIFFNDIFKKLFPYDENDEDYEIESYYELIESLGEFDDVCAENSKRKDGHKIGGYPRFTQIDPRKYHKDFNRFDYLLFQLDTDRYKEAGIEVMWGDYGIGNFFINKEKLKAKDFSDVLYNWDCG